MALRLSARATWARGPLRWTAAAQPALVARGRCFCVAAAQQLSWTEARFSGATIILPPGPIQPGLGEQLDVALAEIRAAGRKGVWMRVPIEQSAAIPVAAKQGFKYHHAEADHAMLLNWLPPTPSPVRPGRSGLTDCLLCTCGRAGVRRLNEGHLLCIYFIRRSACSPAPCRYLDPACRN
jgi:hypothetical protein